jgi:hypothetical protein
LIDEFFWGHEIGFSGRRTLDCDPFYFLRPQGHDGVLYLGSAWERSCDCFGCGYQ